MPTELQQKTYESIMGLFDCNEKFLDKVEEMGERAEPFIPEINKILLTVEDNAEILVDNFLKYMKSGRTLSGVEKMKIEKAQNAINEAINNFLTIQS